jgi:protein-S-isoprenylcysteine O-methyltransferase Ste14
MLAFVGVAVGFPPLVVSVVCALKIGLFVYMAMDDERVLLASAMAVDYERYKLRVGMFLPRLEGKR